MGAKQLIRYEDFASVNVLLKLRNLVTQTVVDSKVKTLADGQIGSGVASENNVVQLLEILQEGVAISVPKLTCTMGHSLEITFSVSNLASNGPMEFSFLGKVTAVDKSSDEQDRIEVELKIGSDKIWDEFCRRYAAKQESVNELFKSIRGY